MSHRSCCHTLLVVADVVGAFMRIKWMGQPARGTASARGPRRESASMRGPRREDLGRANRRIDLGERASAGRIGESGEAPWLSFGFDICKV